MSNETMLDRLEERATGMRRPEEFKREPGVFALDERKTGEIRPYTLDSNEEYVLQLTVGCRYWANTVQRADQRRNAERIIADLLYRDVLAGLSELRHAIYDGDKNAALRRVAEIEGSIRR